MAINYVNLAGVATGSARIDSADVLYINPLDAEMQASSNAHLTTLDPSGAPLDPQVVQGGSNSAANMVTGLEESGTSQGGSGGSATRIGLKRGIAATVSAIAAAQMLVMQRQRGLTATVPGTTTLTAAAGVKKALGGTAAGTSRIEGDTLFWKDQYNQEVYLEVVGTPIFNGDNSDVKGDPGTWSVPVKLRRGSGGPGGSLTGCRIAPGTAAIKWGTTVTGTTSFTGGILMTSDQTNAPYMDVFTVDRAGAVGDQPWDDAAVKPRVRLGNLAGMLGNSNVRWGIAMSSDLSSSIAPYIESSNSGLNISNANVTIKNGTFYAGAADRSKYIEWDGANLNIVGQNGSTTIDGANIITGTITLDKLSAGDSLSIATNGLLYMSFDGPTPYNTNFTGSATGNFGQKPTITGGLIYRQGLFSKTAQFAEATTNLIKNPGFEWASSSGLQNWNYNDTSGLDAAHQCSSVPYGLFGTYCLQIAKDSTGTTSTTSTSNAITGNTKYALSGYVRVTKAATGTVTLYVTLYDVLMGYATTYTVATVNASALMDWQRFSTTFTSAGNHTQAFVSCAVTGIGATAQFDGLQLERKDYSTPFCDGSLGIGHSWSGAIHNSTSSRTATSLTYLQSGNINTKKGSVAAWVFLDSAGTYTNSRIIMNLAATTGAIRMGVDTTGHLFGYWGVGQLTSSTTLSPFTWYHLAMTYDGSTLKLYINGVQSGSLVTTDLVQDATKTIEVGSMTGSYQLNGFMDDFIISDGTFTAAQLLAIYSSRRPLQVGKGNFDLMLSGGSSGGWIQGNGDGLYGYSSDGTAQVWFGTDGKLYAGAGNVILDKTGVSVVGGSFNSNALTWYADNTLSYEMGRMYLNSVNPGIAQFNLSLEGTNRLQVNATKTSITSSQIFSYGNHIVTGGLDVGFITDGWPASGDIWAKNFYTQGGQSLANGGFSVVLDGAGQTIITSGARAYFEIPYSMRITTVSVLANTTTNFTAAIYKTTYASLPTWTSIGTISITSAQKNTYSLGTNWDAVAGDIWAVNCTACSAATMVSLCFKGYRT